MTPITKAEIEALIILLRKQADGDLQHDAVIRLLQHPPSAAKFDDPNDYYDYWWSLLLKAAAPAHGEKEGE